MRLHASLFACEHILLVCVLKSALVSFLHVGTSVHMIFTWVHCGKEKKYIAYHTFTTPVQLLEDFLRAEQRLARQPPRRHLQYLKGALLEYWYYDSAIRAVSGSEFGRSK